MPTKIELHVHQLVRVNDSPSWFGRITEIVGDNWIQVRPLAGGWPKTIERWLVVPVPDNTIVGVDAPGALAIGGD